MWKRLYKRTSGTECGTFYQLLNFINCQDVGRKVNESEDFLKLMVTGYIIVCTMEVLDRYSTADRLTRRGVDERRH